MVAANSTDPKLGFLIAQGADRVSHGEGSLLGHLTRTQDVLRCWGAEQSLADAGMFHAVYGTPTFKWESVSLSRRSELVELLGAESERLVYLYSVLDPSSLVEAIAGVTQSKGRSNDTSIKNASTDDHTLVSASAIAALANILVANQVEQCRSESDRLVLSRYVRLVWPLLLPAARSAFSQEISSQRMRLEAIAEVLTWRSNSGLVEEARAAHMAHMAPIVADKVQALGGVNGANLHSMWGELPNAAQRELILAPATFHRLGRNSSASFEERERFLSDSIVALSLRNGKGQPETYGVWTPLGDHYFPASSSIHGTTTVTGDAQTARRLGRIVLDVWSPYSSADLEAGPEFEQAHSSEEVEAIHRGLQQALHLLENASAEAAEMVNLSLQVVSIKRDLASPTCASSGSWLEQIGKCALTNAHLIAQDHAGLANALLHEAIHSCLYRIELNCPFYALEAPQDATAVSPWTGSTLSAQSFTHACFIWFGLWNFWRTPGASKVFTAPIARRRAADAARGFGDAYLPTLKSLAMYILPDLLKVLASCQTLVIATSEAD